MTKVTGKVAQVLDNRTLVLNVGQNKGVELGMKFLISSGTGTEIKDPDTGSVLGKVALPKVRVEVTRVDSKYSVAETYEYETINEGGAMSTVTIGKMFQQPRLIKKYKTFEIEDDQKKALDKEKSIVVTGDLAEQIEGNAAPH